MIDTGGKILLTAWRALYQEATPGISFSPPTGKEADNATVGRTVRPNDRMEAGLGWAIPILSPYIHV